MSKQEQPQYDLNEKFYVFDNFITSNKHILERGDNEWDSSKIFFQLSVEHADNSPLTHGAEKFEEGGKVDWDYVRDVNRDKEMYINPLFDIFDEHTEKISNFFLLDNQNILSWDKDQILKLNRDSGECIVLDKSSSTFKNVFLLSNNNIVSYEDTIIKIYDNKMYKILSIINNDNSEIMGLLETSDNRLLYWNSKNEINFFKDYKLEKTIKLDFDYTITGLIEFDDYFICWNDDNIFKIVDYEIKEIYTFYDHPRFDIRNDINISKVNNHLCVTSIIRVEGALYSDRGLLAFNENDELEQVVNVMNIGYSNNIFSYENKYFIYTDGRMNSSLYSIDTNNNTIALFKELDYKIDFIQIDNNDFYVAHDNTIDILDSEFNLKNSLSNISGKVNNIQLLGDIIIVSCDNNIYFYDRTKINHKYSRNIGNDYYHKKNNYTYFYQKGIKYFYKNGKYETQEHINFDDSSSEFYQEQIKDIEDETINSFNELIPINNKLYSTSLLQKYSLAKDISNLKIYNNNKYNILVKTEHSKPMFLKYVNNKGIQSLINQSKISIPEHLDEKYFSNILQDILSVNGIKQGLKTKFIFHFIHKILKLRCYDQNLKLGNTQIFREYGLSTKKMSDKNIDLLLLDLDDDVVIGIENKFLGEDSEKQLDNYYNSLKYQFEDVISNVFLVYLTLDGSIPKYTENKNIICLSWIDDIYPMILKSIEDRKGQKSNFKPNNNINDVLNIIEDIATIRSFPENLKHPFDLNSFINKLYEYIQDNRWKLKIKNSKGIVSLNNRKSKNSKYKIEIFINSSQNSCVLKSNNIKVNLPFGYKTKQINYLIIKFFEKLKIDISKKVSLEKYFDIPIDSYKIYKYFNSERKIQDE